MSSSELTVNVVEQPRVESKHIPREEGRRFWGSTIDFREDHSGFLKAMHDKHGDVFRAKVVPLTRDWYFVRNAEVVNAINVTYWADFYKPKLAKIMWKPFLGNGLVPNDGPDWKRQHKRILPGFHKIRIDGYGSCMVDHTHMLIEQMKQGQIRDFRHDMTQLTVGVIAKTMFDVEVGPEEKMIDKAVDEVCKVLVEYVHLPIPVPNWWPSPRNRRKVGAIKALEALISRLVEERRAEGKDRGDLFSHMVFTEDEEGRMTDTQLRDEAMTLIFAGHETTAHALTWAWYLLANNPDKAEKLRKELETVLQGKRMEVEDLAQLPYLEKVAKEAMRLIPSVWSYAREPQRDINICGYDFPKGAMIFISPFMLGRDERYYDKPLEFRPERWTREFERKLPRGAYVPFAAGPRVCLGKQFAMMEMRMVLGTLIQHVMPRIQEGFSPDFMYELSLNPGDRGLKVQVDFHDQRDQTSPKPVAPSEVRLS